MIRNRFYTVQRSIADQVARAQSDPAAQPSSLDNAAVTGGNLPTSGGWAPTGMLDATPLQDFRLK